MGGRSKRVLILVLMEDTLRVRRKKAIRRKDVRLNPCSNGRYSQSPKENYIRLCLTVLILVLMEDTLRVLIMLLL